MKGNESVTLEVKATLKVDPAKCWQHEASKKIVGQKQYEGLKKADKIGYKRIYGDMSQGRKSAPHSCVRAISSMIGAFISFYATINITNGILNGIQYNLILLNIFNDLSLSFRVTPLGAVFGLLCSGLWILAAIYSIGYMRGNNEKKQTRFYVFYSLSIY